LSLYAVLIQHFHKIQPTCSACNEPLRHIQEGSILIFRGPFIYLPTCVYIRIPADVKILFSKVSRPALEPTKPLFDVYWGLFPKGKAIGVWG